MITITTGAVICVLRRIWGFLASGLGFGAAGGLLPVGTGLQQIQHHINNWPNDTLQVHYEQR
jgi:hypothetical protein